MSKMLRPKALPINDQTPKDHPIIAWCPELADWTIVEYTTHGHWRDAHSYTRATPTHWLPIELPEVQEN